MRSSIRSSLMMGMVFDGVTRVEMGDVRVGVGPERRRGTGMRLPEGFTRENAVCAADIKRAPQMTKTRKGHTADTNLLVQKRKPRRKDCVLVTYLIPFSLLRCCCFFYTSELMPLTLESWLRALQRNAPRASAVLSCRRRASQAGHLNHGRHRARRHPRGVLVHIGRYGALPNFRVRASLASATLAFSSATRAARRATARGPD